MLFAPSGDPTDDPSIMNLFIADSGASGGDGQIVEVSLTEPVLQALPESSTGAVLVNTIHTSAWNPPSPDPAGIAYRPDVGRLLISDSEVEEMPPYWAGANVFDATTAGSLVTTCDVTTFTNEPTGVAVNPNNGHIFFSDDGDSVYEVHLGADGQYCTADDTVTSFSTAAFNSFDAEGLAFGQGNLYIADGVGAEIYIVSPGANGIFDGVSPVGDDQVTSFDTASLNQPDPEGIEFRPDTNTLFIVSNNTSSAEVVETTTAGAPVRVIDIGFVNAVAAAGLAYAPGSADPAVNHLYMAARGVDNGADPNENDGKVYEICLDCPLPDLIFADGFESGDFSAWSDSRTDSGDLSVSSAAAIAGAYGMQAVLDDTNTIFVTDERPASEPRYIAGFSFDPNSIAMLSGDSHYLFYGLNISSTVVVRIQFRISQGSYEIRGAVFNDAGGSTNTAWVPISDAPHRIEFDWRAATAAGANDGAFTLSIDGQQQGNLTGIDNDTYRVDRVRLGAVASIDTGTLGTTYFDDFESRRQPAGTPTPTPTATSTPTASATPTNTPTSTSTPTNTPTQSNTPTATSTPTDTPTPSNTPTPTPTPTDTSTPTVTSTPTQTDTPAPTDTPTPSNTPTDTPTPTLAPSVLTFTPADDASVRASSPDNNYGSTTTLEVDNSPQKNFLLKFVVSGVNGRPIAGAQLRLFNVNASDRGGDLHRVADNSWSESTVTWNSAPAGDAAVLAPLGAVSTNTWYEVDVTSLITGDGTYSLRVTSPSSNGADYTSKEGAAGFAPQLIVSVNGSPTPTPTDTPDPNATPTDTPTPTSTPTPSPTPMPTATPTATNTPTSTPTPSPTPVVLVTSINPDTMQAGSTISAVITGSNFSQGAVVRFENGSGPAPTTSGLIVVDSNTISLTLTTKSGGPPRARIWDVRVTNPDGSSGVLVGGFVVMP
jgi:hypothetical protein